MHPTVNSLRTHTANGKWLTSNCSLRFAVNVDLKISFIPKPQNNRNNQIRNSKVISNTSSARLKIARLNIRSLRNRSHFLQAREFAICNNINVFTVSETWLNTTVKNSEIEIEGYKLIRLDRLHKKGGGVCAYIRSNIKTLLLKDLSFIADSNFHKKLWIQIQHKKLKSLIICVVYRLPDSALDCFDLLL